MKDDKFIKIVRKAHRLLSMPERIRQKIPFIKRPIKIDIYAERKPAKDIVNPRKVSAVIPNYNYGRYIIERIDSVLFQTYPIYELIILDDCSTDNSLNIIKEKIEQVQDRISIRLIVNEKNGGNVFLQWKRAFEEAKGDYIWIAEADDSCASEFLETVMKGFDYPETVISYCESLTMDENNHLLMENLRPWIDQTGCGKWNQDYMRGGVEEIAETMCINNTIANVSSVVFKKGDYASFFDVASHFQLAGDWYIYMKVLEGGTIVYSSRSLNYHRMHNQGKTLSTQHEQEYKEIVWLQEYAFKHYPVSEKVRKQALERRERERIRFGLQ